MDKPSLRNRVSLSGCFFADVVVLPGACTRLVDAGPGCPDWPGCYGFSSVPETEEEIQIAEQAYPHAPVETGKAWPEMVHTPGQQKQA
ncbi:MAG: COX15/CtaA family protein [Gammaproteobacteria bacterium]|nr:COX15/CtaA family protein [Gammaproteobacteria bacterium]